MLETCTFAVSLCCKQKGPITTPVCQWAAVCRASHCSILWPCVQLSLIPHTFHPLSVSLLCTLSINLTFLSVLPAVICTVISFCNTVSLFLFPCSLASGIMQSCQKRVVRHACLRFHATLAIHFKSVALFPVTCCHSRPAHTKTHSNRLRDRNFYLLSVLWLVLNILWISFPLPLLTWSFCKSGFPQSKSPAAEKRHSHIHQRSTPPTPQDSTMLCL